MNGIPVPDIVITCPENSRVCRSELRQRLHQAERHQVTEGAVPIAHAVHGYRPNMVNEKVVLPGSAGCGGNSHGDYGPVPGKNLHGGICNTPQSQVAPYFQNTPSGNCISKDPPSTSTPSLGI